MAVPGVNDLRLVKPESQQQTTIQPADENAKLFLEFDPGTATMTKDGQALVFTFDDGSSIRVEGFYDTFTSKTPPTFVLGDAEIDAQTFFAANEDLMPAAGPAAAAATGGRYNEFGNADLIGGNDALGGLDPGRNPGFDPDVPYGSGGGAFLPAGGSFDLDVSTPLGGAFTGAVYEDARPYQHLYADGTSGDVNAYGQINFNFTPSGASVVTAVHLSGFDAGTTLYIGDPNGPDGSYTVIDITSPGQVVDFTPDNFINGVYVKPPANSDSDMNISAQVDVSNPLSGASDTIGGNFTLVVDAVADRPEEVGNDFSISHADVNGNILSYPEAAHGDTITMHVNAVFSDIADGSENHYLLLQVQEGWENPGYPVVIYEGVSYYYVDAATLTPDASGTYTATFTLTAPTTGTIADTVSFQNGALSIEGSIENGVPVIRDEEGTGTGLSNANNVAFVPGGVVDVPFNIVNAGDNTLTGGVTDGYEDGKSAIHTNTTAGNENGVITIRLDDTDNDHIYGSRDGETTGNASGSDAVTVTFNFSGTDLGTFVVDGNTYSVGNGITDNHDGTYTLRIPAADLPKSANGSTDLSLEYRPAANDDTDLTNIGVKVNVQADTSSGNAILDVNLGTDTTLVVDAVADKPEVEDLSTTVTQQDNVGHGATGEAKDVAITVKATFGDVLDGSEKHSFELNGVPAGWALDQAQLPSGWVVSGQTDNGDGTYTLIIDVTNAATAAGQADGTGTVGTTLHFNPGDWTSGGLTDGQGAEHGRHSDGTPNTSGPAEITITAVAEENASDGELPDTNNRSETELGTITVTLTEDTPTATVNGSLFTDEKPGEQGVEADWASVSPATKGVIDHALDALEQKGISGLTVPMNLTIPGSSSSSVLGASTTTVSYNLYSDGRGDANQGGSTVGFSIDTSSLPQSAKLPGDAGYSDIHYEPVTDSAGNLCVVGYFTNTGGDKVVALVVTVEPDNLNGGAGTANVTIVQYTAFEHSAVQGSNTDTYNIKLTLADDDGDKVAFDVTYVTQDDTPLAFEDRGDLDETVRDNNGQSMAGGNVLNNDQGTADGWEGGDKGVVGCKIMLPADYSIDGDPAALSLGAPYTIMYNGVAQGTFILNADGNWQFTSGTGQDIIKDFDFTVHYTVRDADGDTDSATLTIGAKSAPIMAGISGDSEVFESNRTSNGSVDDVAGVAHYTIQTYDANGAVVKGPGLYEDVRVTLAIDPAARLADIDLDALSAKNPGLTFTVNPDNTITVTIPANDADGKVDFYLPMKDDALGGGSTSSDGPTENYTLKVVEVTGDTTGHYVAPTDPKYGDLGISTGQGTTIVDDGTVKDANGDWVYADNRLDGGTPYNHNAADGHPLDGPMFKLGTMLAGGTLTEGESVDFTLAGTLNPNTGAAYAADSHPAETTSLTMRFVCSDGANAADVIIKGMNVSGATYFYKDTNGDWQQLAAGDSIPESAFTNGGVDIKVELDISFDLSNLANVGLNVSAVNDVLAESGEKFTLSLTGAEGGESTYYGDALSSVTIKDDDSKLEIGLGWSTIVNESGPSDTAYAPQDNTTYYALNIKHDGPVAPENEKLNLADDVTLKLTITGQNGAQFNAGAPTESGVATQDGGDDAYWKELNSWKLDLDGTQHNVSSVTGDNASGFTITFDNGFVLENVKFSGNNVSVTVPKSSVPENTYDAISIKVGVGITDDLRENEAGESLNAKLDYDGGSISGNTEIVPDQRPASGPEHLNPAKYDGPYVTLSGTTDIDEGAGGTRSNVATYTINLVDPQNGTSLFDHNDPKAHETVTVTLSVKGLSGAFTFGDINWSGITVNGVALNASNYNAATGTITVDIPVGSNSITLNIPAADDHFGGVDPTTDALADKQLVNDTAEERFSLTITDVFGNEARVTTSTTVDGGGTVNLGISQETVIHDDGVGGGKLDGPVVNAVLGKTSTTENANVTLKLEFKDPNNSAQGYKNPSGNTTLVEDTKVLLHFGGENAPAQFGIDYTINRPTTVSYDSITISFTIPSGMTFNDFLSTSPSFTTYSFIDSNGNPLTTLAALKAATGEVSVTYTTTSTSVGLPSFMDSVDLRAHNVSIEADVTYKIPGGTNVGSGLNLTVAVTNDTYTEGSEGIKITVVDTEGNESVAGNGGSLTITDEMGGRISIANAAEVLEGQDLVFKLSVTGTTISSSPNFNENVVVKLLLTGKDGTGLNAASLEDIDFDRLQAANPNIVIDSYNPATGEVTIILSHDDWTHATSTSHNYDLHIPTKVDSLLAEAREGVQVSITDAKGAEIDLSKSTGTSATGTIKDEAGLRIAGDTVIYEDAVHGKTVATYHVEVLDKLVAVGDGSGKVAGQGFSFDITLQDGKANFDSNIQNNYVTAGDPTSDLLHNSNVGDYGWAIDGKIIQYGDLTTNAGKEDLIKAINDFLASDSKYDGIRVIDVTNGGRSLTFEVAEGASIDALEDMPIQVAAIDDAKTELDESYTVRIGNIVEKGTADGHESLGTNEAHVGSGNVKTSENTVIKDDGTAESRDGYYVGLKAATAAESSGGAIVPVAFFQHDASGNIINADRNNPPSSEGFTLKLGTQNDGATQNEDFVVDNSTVSIPPYSANNGNWSYVEASGTTPAHWEYKVDLSAHIPIKDDRLTEGNEDFKLELKEVSGHESSKLPGTGVVGDVKNEVNITIEDDKTLTDGPYKLDGPEISFFGPMGKVIEPVAPGMTSDDPDAPTQDVTYRVGLSQTAAQDVVLFINIPNVGDDFTLEYTANFGLLTADKLAELKLAYPHYNLESNGAGYFLIIPKGQSSGEITVQILHDHDSSSVAGGKDDASLGGNAEHVHMEITNMQGSEARYNPGDANNTTHTPIQDDMHGPVVSFGVSGNRLEWSGASEPHISIKLPVSCDEDVTVRIELRDASGNLLQDASGNTLYLIHTFTGGAAGVADLDIAALLAKVLQDNPGISFTLGTDFFIKIAGVTGGEAQADTNLIYMDHDSGTSIELDNFKASDIHEGLGDTVVYTLDLEIPSGYTIPAGGVSFDLKVLHNGTANQDFGQGTDSYPETVTVTIPKDQLELLPKDAANHITIKNGPDGPGVYYNDGNEDKKIGEVSDNLPSAFDDKLVEGDEGFYTIITNPSGVDIDDAVADSKIIDNDKPIVKVEFVDANGNVLTSAPEGGEAYVRVSLVDGDGNPVTLGGGSADFALNFTGGTNPGEATEGSDFYSSFGHVTIPGGSSQSNTVKVVLPDDFISEGDEKFSVSANYVQDAYSNYGDATIFGTVEGSELTVTDHINGPVISFAGTSSTTEKGSANYTVTLDKSLEQKAELLFKLDLSDGDSKDGFVITEIDTIKVDGITYTISEDGQSITTSNGVTYNINDTTQKVHLGADGDLYVSMTMEDRSVRESFQVTLRNDYISENDEILKVTLVDTKGGELHLGNGLEVTADNGPSVNTTVKDYLDGPTVSLNKLDTSGTEGESVSVSIGLSKPTVSESTIELQLGSDVAAKVVNGTTVTVSNSSGFSGTGTIDPATGKVTITLPAGTSGPLTVTFPLQDNVITGDNPQFSISLGGAGALVGGETSLAGSLSFGSSFAGETNNSMTFDMSGSGATSADAQGSLTLGNIAGGANSVDHITLTYPGSPPVVVTVPASALAGSDSTLTYNWNAPAGASLEGVKVDVVFKQDGTPGAMTAQQLADTKLNATVNGSLSGMSVTVDVKDDAGTSLQDGPVFAIDAPDSVAEGSAASFTLTAESLGDLAGGMLTQSVSITFTVSGASGAVISSAGSLSGPLGGVYTLTLPAGTNLNNALPTISFNTAQDNLVDSGRTAGITLTGATGQEAGVDSGTVTTEVHDTTIGTAFGLAAADTTVVEGEDAVFNLSWNKALFTKCADPVTLSLTVDAELGTQVTDGFGGTHTVGQDGLLVLTLTAAQLKNNSSLKLTVPVADDGLPGSVADTDGSITINLDSVQLQGEASLTVTGKNAGMGIIDGGLAAFGASFAGTLAEGGDQVQLNFSLLNMAALQGILNGNVLTEDVDLTVRLTDAEGTASTHTITLHSGYDVISGDVFTIDGVPLGHDVGSVQGLYGSLNVQIVAVNGADATSVQDASSPYLINNSYTLDFSHAAEGVQYTAGHDDAYSIQGSDHADTITGGAGDDLLFGGGGNDTLHGGAGNDFLHGGLGANALFGGEGNDILVFSADNIQHDGGDGLDILVGGSGTTFDAMATSANDIEVFLTTDKEPLDLTNLDAFKDLGIQVNADDSVLLDLELWTRVEEVQSGENVFVHFQSDDGDLYVLQHLVSNQAG